MYSERGSGGGSGSGSGPGGGGAAVDSGSGVRSRGARRDLSENVNRDGMSVGKHGFFSCFKYLLKTGMALDWKI